MSIPYISSLAVLVILAVSARFALPGLPLSQKANRISAADAVLIGLGVTGLLAHCMAMFFPELVDPFPWTTTATTQIRGLSTASVVWFVVPCCLVLFGLRRIHQAAFGAVAVSLVGVGISMYNGGSLAAHLGWIFVLVLVMVAVAAAFVLPPRRTPLARP
ncbi:MAG: hypothetical protein LH630_06650 [Actinomycetia bacterium]|nr:hypothetical protein [Actinomycetes bacterium]